MRRTRGWDGAEDRSSADDAAAAPNGCGGGARAGGAGGGGALDGCGAGSSQQEEEPHRDASHPSTAADPDAEVIGLSPGTLLATNRFVCEVCGKGFQRDQNLQLHRCSHKKIQGAIAMQRWLVVHC